MCFDLYSRPPIPPIAGAAVDGALIRLKAADGTDFSGFHAVPSTPSGAAMLILPDVRGLHPFYEELALRFAENGVEALAVDYFGRTAGLVDDGSRGEEFDYQTHVGQVQYDTLLQDFGAGRDALAGRAGVGAVFSVGFCFGGRLSLLLASNESMAMAGAIGFYAWPVGESRGGVPAPIDEVGRVRAPILGLFGGADQGIPAATVEAYREALTGAGKDAEIVLYTGAPHSFFDRKAAEFGDASTDAWRRVRDFVHENTPHA